LFKYSLKSEKVFKFCIHFSEDSNERIHERRQRQRELSVESDYPELSLDFPLGAAGNGGNGGGVGVGSGNVGLYGIQRLEQDLRDDCETVIAGNKLFINFFKKPFII